MHLFAQKFIKWLAVGAAGLMAQQSLANQVAVSNYPLYLLSQAVTNGQNDAVLLLKAGDVGHHGSLSPTAVKAVKDSRFVVWFGADLEQNLVNTLKNQDNAISLFSFKAFIKKPMRDIDGKAIAGSFDPHIWLDPVNAKAIVAALAVIHSHANPQHKATYQANASAFFKKMDTATAQFKTAKNEPYWAYHDSFQYLEKSLNLTLKATLTPDHHLSPKASRFKVLNENRPKKTMCLASQTPISKGISERLSPIASVVRQEDMSDGNDFVSVWADTAQALRACVEHK